MMQSGLPQIVLLCLLPAVACSLLTERFICAVRSGSKLSFSRKINFKCLLAVLTVNLAVWLLCFYVNKSAPFVSLLMCIGFDVLFCISAEDIKCKQISEILLIAFFIIAVAVTVIDKSMAWYIHIIGCAVGYLPMLIVGEVGKAVKKQEVLGKGDIYLSGILGLALGLYKYLLCGILASLVALAVIRIMRHNKKYDKMHTYPFSPFYLLGYTVSALFGNFIIEKYILWITSTV